MKLFAALGPGDIVAAHRSLMSGSEVKSVTSVTFSGQFFEFCREQGVHALGVSHNSRVDSLMDDNFQIENCPRFLDGSGGLLFYVSQVLRAFYLAYRAKRFGADLAIIDSGSAHYFALSAFSMLGIPVIVNFHNTLWPNGFPAVSAIGRVVRALDAMFFRYFAAGAIGVSPECGRQMRQLAARDVPFFDYRSQFRKEGFQSRERLPSADKAFRVGFVSRIERNKGALDLVSIAHLLRNDKVNFDVCGDGSALNELELFVRKKSLGGIITIHGRLSREKILEMYGAIDTVIVPTRSDFSEGLPLVCAEAVISNLPIVTSRLSNALDLLGPAIVEAEPDDVCSYVAQIRRLASDSTLYNEKRDQCQLLARQFFDRSKSLPAALDQLILFFRPEWVKLVSYEPIFERLL